MSRATLIEKCCLIANPVAGNPTHYLVEHAFTQKGLDWRFMSFEIEVEALADAVRGLRALGFRGIKVGDPFHEAVIEHLDEVSDVARRCGSVNSVTMQGERLVGDNTEGPAMVNLLRQHIELVGRQATIVGAGRLARAIAVALADAGASTIAVASRNPEAGARLAQTIQKETPAKATNVTFGESPLVIEPETAVLVNATGLGMVDARAELPLKIDSIGAKAIVADVAYHAPRTWLTQQAAERGCRVIDGLSLYVEQTALALREWTGVMPETVAMREAAEEFLGV